MIFAFFILFDSFWHMSEYKEILKENVIARYESLNLSQLYQELNKALTSNNIQSLWKLSKAITRYHFKD
jgi:hypothetical protein